MISLVSLIIYSGFKVFEQQRLQKEVEDVNKNPVIYTNDMSNAIVKLQKEYNNKDIKGILKIAGLSIILVQGNDNDYYLNHLVNKKQNKTGSVFIDYRTDITVDKQVNIYGHSSDYYDIPFNILKKYMNKDFYLNNNKAYIDTVDESYEYEIFSVKITSDESHLKVKFNALDEFMNHIAKLRSGSLYDTGVNVNKEDDILVIQTCINNNPLGKLLIINLRKVG